MANWWDWIFTSGAAWRLIREERERAEKKFPDQHLPQGTGPDTYPLDSPHIAGKFFPWLCAMPASELAKILKDVCQTAGTPEAPDTWAKVIGEEFGEYLEASDPAHIKAELIQLGAMVVRALEDIIRTEGEG